MVTFGTLPQFLGYVNGKLGGENQKLRWIDLVWFGNLYFENMGKKYAKNSLADYKIRAASNLINQTLLISGRVFISDNIKITYFSIGLRLMSKKPLFYSLYVIKTLLLSQKIKAAPLGSSQKAILLYLF
jgi:hypothetical protein